MIYLKKYKTFENIFSDYAKEINEYESIKDHLKDILLELEDEGFDIDIEGRWLRTSEFEELTGYEVKIKRSKTFLLEDIYDYILTCKSYLKEMGFFINGDISGNIPRNGRQERYGLSYSIDLHEEDPEKYKLFDKELISLDFTIRKK